MIPENEHVVRRFFGEVWNAGDLAVADELVASEHQHHLGDEALRGPDGVKEAVTWLRGGFPDLTFTIEDEVSDGDRVAVRWTATGTHEGTIFDVPPTGRRVRWTGIDLIRLEDGKLVELWAEADGAGLMEQLVPDE
jgi:steroid delta-isomerase-like uncharacterized protein